MTTFSWHRRLVAAHRVVAAIWVLLWLPATARAQSEAVEYYGTDALGSVRVVFDASGNIVSRMDYGPFGNELAPTTGKQGQIYAGLFADSGSGFDHAAARAYQIRVGRFSSVDIADSGLLEPQRWNRYAYALNNPVSFVDPTGLQTDSGTSCQQQSVVRGDDGVWRTTSNCPGGGSGGGGGGSSSGPSAGMMDMFNWLGSKFLDAFTTAVVYAPEIEPQSTGNAYHPPRAVEIAVDATVIAVAVAAGAGGAVARGLAAEEAAIATVSEGTTIYRVFGNQARPFSRSWTPQDPRTISNYRAAAGLFPGNSGEFLYRGETFDRCGVGIAIRPTRAIDNQIDYGCH